MWGRRKSNERGAAIIEFALVLPILVVLVFGIIQFGLYFNRAQAFNAAAREGARIGAIPTTSQSDIQTSVLSALGAVKVDDLESAPAVAVTPDTDFPCRDREGESIVVEVTSSQAIEIPVWPSNGTSVGLTGRGEFRCE